MLSVIKQSASTARQTLVNTPSDLRIYTQKPKFPQYAVVSKRMQSFATWPEYLPVIPHDLVEAGLVYTGVGDSVRCYHCGGGLKNWDRGDVPMEEHAKWYPNCTHVLLVMGQEYVDMIGRGERSEKDSLANVEVQSTDPMESLACRSCLEMNFNEDLVRSAVKLFIATHGHANFNGVDIARLCLEMEEKPNTAQLSTCEQGSIHSHSVFEPDCTLKSEDIIVDEECIEKLTQENQRMKDDKICKICLDKTADVIFLPCGHMVSCPQCALAMKKCPICRKTVNGQLKVVFPASHFQAG